MSEMISRTSGLDCENTLFIGTCRVKRPRVHFCPRASKHTTMLKAHLHYPAEIEQALLWTMGRMEISSDAAPLVFDELNRGESASHEALNERRAMDLISLQSSRRVILEISSLKSLMFSEMDTGSPIHANITSVGALRRRGEDRPSILEGTAAMLSEITARKVSREEFEATMHRVVDLFEGKHVVLVPHTRATMPDGSGPIGERLTLELWVREFAELRGCDYFDQSVVSDHMGEGIALKDSSHYTEAGEEMMGRMLEALVLGQDPESAMNDQLLSRVA